MKSSGFDIENTHLQDIERIQKLVLLVMVAFVWCYKVGIYLNLINPIKIKKHGRMAKKYFQIWTRLHRLGTVKPSNQNNNKSIISCYK